MSGGSALSQGCVVLCLLKLNKIHELDAGNPTLLCDAGCITQSIADAAEAPVFTARISKIKKMTPELHFATLKIN